jgi:hypothetical protein
VLHVSAANRSLRPEPVPRLGSNRPERAAFHANRFLWSTVHWAGWSPAFSGQQVSVDWTVTNTGNAATFETDWADAVYLSFDGALDSSSILLGARSHSADLGWVPAKCRPSQTGGNCNGSLPPKAVCLAAALSGGAHTAATGTWSGNATAFNAPSFTTGNAGSYALAVSATTVGATAPNTGNYALTVNPTARGPVLDGATVDAAARSRRL